MKTEAFHIDSQHKSIISSRIAEAAQRDGMTMKTISILGIIFLPGTLISVLQSQCDRIGPYQPLTSHTVDI